MTDNTYNGYTNYNTWNVALWLQNDEGLYQLARRCEDYKEVVFTLLDCGVTQTPDGIDYNDIEIDEIEMDQVISEL